MTFNDIYRFGTSTAKLPVCKWVLSVKTLEVRDSYWLQNFSLESLSTHGCIIALHFITELYLLPVSH